MLQPFFQTPEQQFKQEETAFRRNQKHYKEILESFPKSESVSHLSMDNIGKDTIRAFIHLPKNISKEETRTLIKWLTKFTGKSDRIFRENDGHFSWRTPTMKLTDDDGEYDYIVFIEGAHPLECVIKRVTKTVECFESDCKPNNEQL